MVRVQHTHREPSMAVSTGQITTSSHWRGSRSRARGVRRIGIGAAVSLLTVTGTLAVPSVHAAPAEAASVCPASWSSVKPVPPTGLAMFTAAAASANGQVFAVGYGIPGGNNVTQPFAETWNGSSWSVTPTQSVTAQDTEFTAVAMSGTNDGWAVGWD